LSELVLILRHKILGFGRFLKALEVKREIKARFLDAIVDGTKRLKLLAKYGRLANKKLFINFTNDPGYIQTRLATSEAGSFQIHLFLFALL
jgi:hypothetical protein